MSHLLIYILKEADVLVLDEATSDLDSKLEKEVQQSIENLDRDYAMIGIAHRLSTVRNADRIYTMDSSEIIKTGSHEELIKNDGRYAELHDVQS
jgi:subfamily B ATP-binding cassette protein MsbA